jgi:hypothetical protein
MAFLIEGNFFTKEQQEYVNSLTKKYGSGGRVHLSNLIKRDIQNGTAPAIAHKLLRRLSGEMKTSVRHVG